MADRLVNRACALLPLAAVLHWVEELPRFPAWEARHFPHVHTTFSALLESHVPLFLLFGLVGYLGYRSQPSGLGIWAAVALHTAFLVNVAFQVACTVVFCEYVPGDVTCALVFVPLAAWHYRLVLRTRFLRPAGFASAALSGATFSALLSLRVLQEWAVL
jgi:hypothetical protein